MKTTIEEQAKIYAGTEDSDEYAGFVDGAKWALNQVFFGLMKEKKIIYNPQLNHLKNT